MKTKISLLIAAIIFIAWACCETEERESYKLTFSVDMSEVELADTDVIGIRGNVPPLSWTETYTLDGPDENGIFSASVPFDLELECGTRILYKFIISDSVWDNDRYGENGNRLYTYCCTDAVLPVDKWDELDAFTLEAKVNSAAWDQFMSWIYTIGTAKQRGLNMEEITQEIIEFWDWPMPENAKPEDVMMMDKFQQSKTPYEYFEVVTNTPDKAEYILIKSWEKMIYDWSEDGVVYGVTAQDLTEVYKLMTIQYMSKMGFSVDWEDMDDHKLKITIEK
jgi:hypothetical protein